MTVFFHCDCRLKVVVKEVDPRIHFALVCGAKSCPPIRTYSTTVRWCHVAYNYLYICMYIHVHVHVEHSYVWRHCDIACTCVYGFVHWLYREPCSQAPLSMYIHLPTLLFNSMVSQYVHTHTHTHTRTHTHTHTHTHQNGNLETRILHPFDMYYVSITYTNLKKKYIPSI